MTSHGKYDFNKGYWSPPFISDDYLDISIVWRYYPRHDGICFMDVINSKAKQ